MKRRNLTIGTYLGIWQELMKHRMDVSEVNREWLEAFKKDAGLGE